MANPQRQVLGHPVAVIGGAGFLGSHVVEYLLNHGSPVLVIDNLINGKTSHIPRAAKFIWHDIRDDWRELAEILSKNKIRFVINAAAEPYIPESFERPLHFFDINARAVLNVLEAVKWAGVEALLQVSSAEIYGDATGQISEDAPVVPHSTYGVSKMAADGLVQVRWREASVPAIAVRQFNAVGERETHEYVIPEIISQLDKRPQVRLGNNSERDFLYAGDVAKGWVRLLETGTFGQVYNFGSESTVKIYDLARMIGTLMGHKEIEILEDKAKIRPWEIWHLQSDNTKFKLSTGYTPETSLEDALKKTIQWFKSNGNKWNF